VAKLRVVHNARYGDEIIDSDYDEGVWAEVTASGALVLKRVRPGTEPEEGIWLDTVGAFASGQWRSFHMRKAGL
jgi:hypothetical protein